MAGVLVAVGGSASQGGQEGTPGGGDRAERCAERRRQGTARVEALCGESRMGFPRRGPATQSSLQAVIRCLGPYLREKPEVR